MAQTRLEYIERKTAETGQSGTATYDLHESGITPEIQVVAYSTPTASTDPALPLSEAITKIEIVDGGNAIVSATANDLKGLSMINGDRKLASPEINDNGVEGHDVIRVILGGFLNGRNYAPEFSRFDNPQIKISWDYSITTGLRGATYDADTDPAMKFTILARIIENSTAYTPGYIRTQETYTYTQTASSQEEINIPRGEDLIGIGVRAGYDALEITDDLNEVELNINNGEWRPFKLYEDEVISSQKMWFKDPFEVSCTQDLIDGVEIDTHMGYLTDFSGMTHSSAGRSFEYDGIHQGVEAVGLMDVATPSAITTYEAVTTKATGWCPYGVWYAPMSGIYDGDSDVLQTADYRQIKLKLTSSASASTSSTPAVLTQYLVPQ